MRSKNQSVVALSSTEADTSAWEKQSKNANGSFNCSKNFAFPLTGSFRCMKTTILYRACYRHYDHKAPKHIDIRRHFVLDKIKSKDIKSKPISTKKQRADSLTKILNRSLFLLRNRGLIYLLRFFHNYNLPYFENLLA